LVPFGDMAVLVELGDLPDLATSLRIHAVASQLREHPPHGVIESIPGLTSLLVEFDPLKVAAPDVERAIIDAIGRVDARPIAPPRVRVIPTVYGGEYGPDLADVAQRVGLPYGEVIRRHAATEFTVYMLGFSPGYPYMGELPPELVLPRRETPRERVPPGSVAIAGRQSSIYTRTTPGGWHLIGRTPRILFDETRSPPAYLGPGDRVRHLPIDKEAWHALAGPATDW
jgi:KipI family sensor histidine kinase inhibitor